MCSCGSAMLHPAYKGVDSKGKVVSFLYFNNDSFCYVEANSRDSFWGVFERISSKELKITENLHLSNLITSKTVEKYDSTLIDSIAFVIKMKNLNNIDPCRLKLFFDSDSLDLRCTKSIKIRRPDELLTIRHFYLKLAKGYYTDSYIPNDTSTNVFMINIDESVDLLRYSRFNGVKLLVKSKELVFQNENTQYNTKKYNPKYIKFKVPR